MPHLWCEASIRKYHSPPCAEFPLSIEVACVMRRRSVVVCGFLAQGRPRLVSLLQIYIAPLLTSFRTQASMIFVVPHLQPCRCTYWCSESQLSKYLSLHSKPATMYHNSSQHRESSLYLVNQPCLNTVLLTQWSHGLASVVFAGCLRRRERGQAARYTV